MRGASLIGAIATLALGVGCIDVGLIKSTSGAGGSGAVAGNGGAGVSGAGGAAGAPVACYQPGVKQDLGANCGCDGDCASGFCVEGVCCGSACTGGCQTCAAQGLLGICVQRSAGAAPRKATDCVADSPASCGLDGTCDGAGSCRSYLGNTCVAGTCSGAAAVGAYACDGMGQCKPGVSVMLCTPYACDSNSGTCLSHCTDSSQCSGQACDLTTGSCGKVGIGAHCAENADCVSGFCADHVCCNVACAGSCVACNLPGKLGACWPVDAGKPDPRGLCADNGAASCGHNGTCDGVGGCADYPSDTECLAPSCVGNRLNTAGTCDGLGTCRPPGVLDCAPFGCVDGACTASCQASAQCAPGTTCVNGSCGLKQDGLGCASGSECASAFCVDGVCCESACTGSCVSCALPSSPGQCVAIAAGNPDPRNVCHDQGAASCGTNGKCDASAACARYAVGTICAVEACANNAYTPPSTCGPTGQCVAPDTRPCFPYACDGTTCFTACVLQIQCAAPATCYGSTNSTICGLLPGGLPCTSDDQCQSGICAGSCSN